MSTHTKPCGCRNVSTCHRCRPSTGVPLALGLVGALVIVTEVVAWRRGRASTGSADKAPDLSASSLTVGQQVNLQVPYTVTARNGTIVHFDPVDGIGEVPDNRNVRYMGFVVWMPISEFLGLNPPLCGDGSTKKVAGLARELSKGKVFAPPFLVVDVLGVDGLNLWLDEEIKEVIKSFRVRSHEGRHRMTALLQIAGDVSVPVQVFGPRGWRALDFSVDELRGATIHPDPRGSSISGLTIDWFALDGVVGR